MLFWGAFPSTQVQLRTPFPLYTNFLFLPQEPSPFWQAFSFDITNNHHHSLAPTPTMSTQIRLITFNIRYAATNLGPLEGTYYT